MSNPFDPLDNAVKQAMDDHNRLYRDPAARLDRTMTDAARQFQRNMDIFREAEREVERRMDIFREAEREVERRMDTFREAEREVERRMDAFRSVQRQIDAVSSVTRNFGYRW